MADLREIQSIAHEQYKAALAIDRIVGSEEFAASFAKCSESEQAQAEQLVSSNDSQGLNAWLVKHKPLEIMTARELHRLAQSLSVRNYKRLPTSTLIAEIRNASVCYRQAIQSFDAGNLSQSACGQNSHSTDSDSRRITGEV